MMPDLHHGGWPADQRFHPSLGFVQRDFWTKDFGPRPSGVHFCSERGPREGHQSTQLERHGQSLMQKAIRQILRNPDGVWL